MACPGEIYVPGMDIPFKIPALNKIYRREQMFYSRMQESLAIRYNRTASPFGYAEMPFQKQADLRIA
ncbi:hypothetical protein [Candidatus Soleaferrea massiliensis]|uniref:hypothetical protein n=1 Tax=Candidatus Soleaferrea massiliensis TaxID=1470354 RepID=UPI000590AA1C|nr:hypothetical protein [Candidatus Soleaferrea massiliensis]